MKSGSYLRKSFAGEAPDLTAMRDRHRNESQPWYREAVSTIMPLKIGHLFQTLRKCFFAPSS